MQTFPNGCAEAFRTSKSCSLLECWVTNPYLHVMAKYSRCSMERNQATASNGSFAFSHLRLWFSIPLLWFFFTSPCLLFFPQVFRRRHLYHHPRHWRCGDGAAAQRAQDNHHWSGKTESASLRPQGDGRRGSVPGPPHHQHSHQSGRLPASYRYGLWRVVPAYKHTQVKCQKSRA